MTGLAEVPQVLRDQKRRVRRVAVNLGRIADEIVLRNVIRFLASPSAASSQRTPKPVGASRMCCWSRPLAKRLQRLLSLLEEQAVRRLHSTVANINGRCASFELEGRRDCPVYYTCLEVDDLVARSRHPCLGRWIGREPHGGLAVLPGTIGKADITNRYRAAGLTNTILEDQRSDAGIEKIDVFEN